MMSRCVLPVDVMRRCLQNSFTKVMLPKPSLALANAAYSEARSLFRETPIFDNVRSAVTREQYIVESGGRQEPPAAVFHRLSNHFVQRRTGCQFKWTIRELAMGKPDCRPPPAIVELAGALFSIGRQYVHWVVSTMIPSAASIVDDLTVSELSVDYYFGPGSVCQEHVDSGFCAVQLLGSAPGVELFIDDEWLAFPATSIKKTEDPAPVLMMQGFRLERISGGVAKPQLHRVFHVPKGGRVNFVLEVKPRGAIADTFVPSPEELATISSIVGQQKISSS